MELRRANRLLSGVAVAVAILWVQMAAPGHESRADPMPRFDHCPRPIPAEFIAHLTAVYLNDGSPLTNPNQPHPNDAALDQSGSARFQVYVLTDDPRFYCDVTSQFGHALRAHSHRAGVTSRHGFRLVEGSDGPELVYTPSRRSARTRHVTLTFAYRTTHPYAGRYASNFDLTIPGL